MGNVFMTMSRHDLGRQAIVILEKIRKPGNRPEQQDFLYSQADKLLDAWKYKNRSTLNETEGA